MKVFRYLRLSVSFSGINPPISTPFCGSILRGVFGYALRRIFCIFSRPRPCGNCPVRENCFYYRVFETPAPSSSPFKMDFLPHPFLLSPVSPQLKNSREISFDFFLFGKFVDFYPYFYRVFEEMMALGFGGKRARPSQVLITQGPRVLFSSEAQEVGKPEVRVVEIGEGEDFKRAEAVFITPVRVKSGGRLRFPLDFPLLLRNIFRRLSIISYFFEGKNLDVDFRRLLRQGEGVKLTEWEGHRRWIRRLSTRKGGKMEFLGFEGRLVYEGRLRPFVPWLRAGEVFHIGKNTSFGFGKYRLRFFP